MSKFKQKIFIVDIDETICKTPDSRDYNESEPIEHRIKMINTLWEQGHYIKYWTARGTLTGIDWYDITYNQLMEWGCKFHDLEVKKPYYDYWIDDKAINAWDLDKGK